MNKLNIKIYLGALTGCLTFNNTFGGNKNLDQEIKKTNLNKFPNEELIQIFNAQKYIMTEPMKEYMHISTPFNRQIKYIYNLPSHYANYENYNFNKLSDFFLNIHIFIN
jgi:hypothetical protein